MIFETAYYYLKTVINHYWDYFYWLLRTRVIYQENRRQSIAKTEELNKKWNGKILYPKIAPWDLFMELAKVIDFTDNKLITTSQYFHAMQTFQDMLEDNVTDPKLLFLGLMHDIGKVLVLFGENQANVMCSTFILEKNSPLDQCIISWNHDEFGYQRLKNYLPEDMLWAIRYHSLNELFSGELFDIMNQQELLYFNLVKQLNKYDKGSKKIHTVALDYDTKRAKQIMELFLPNPMVF